MKKDLNTTRYGVDRRYRNLLRLESWCVLFQNNGKANHFYINDIYENEMEEESMMTWSRIIAKYADGRKEKLSWTDGGSIRDILGTIADMGYLDEYETPPAPMEERTITMKR